MNWHSTQNDTDSLLLVVYQGFLISAAASDTQLESCQKGTLWLVVSGHVRIHFFTGLEQMAHAPLATPLVTGVMIGWVKLLLFNRQSSPQRTFW